MCQELFKCAPALRRPTCSESCFILPTALTTSHTQTPDLSVAHELWRSQHSHVGAQNRAPPAHKHRPTTNWYRALPSSSPPPTLGCRPHLQQVPRRADGTLGNPVEETSPVLSRTSTLVLRCGPFVGIDLYYDKSHNIGTPQTYCGRINPHVPPEYSYAHMSSVTCHLKEQPKGSIPQKQPHASSPCHNGPGESPHCTDLLPTLWKKARLF